MTRKELIEARGSKTQQEVALNLGVTQKYVSKLELGHRNPSMKLACKISSYYGISLEKLFPDIFLCVINCFIVFLFNSS